MDLLALVKDSATRQELAQKVFDFLTAQDHRLVALVEHRDHPEPFVFLQALNPFSREDWREEMAALNPDHVKPELPLGFGDRYVNYFGRSDGWDAQQPFYVFVFSDTPERSSVDLLQNWRLLDQGYLQAERFQRENLNVEWANLISQLLHDINSLVELTPKENINEELKIRLEYQKKVQEKLLLYIRPLELMTGRLPVKQLLDHSLQIMGLRLDDFVLTISNDLSDIEVDAELFSRAFNELVANAMLATGKNQRKIAIRATIAAGGSPFIPHQWLKLEVEDQGNGINADFLEFVTEPFFTTRKAAGYTGLGLALAKKIIESHGGVLELYSESGRGTTAVVYLPMREK